MNSDKRAEIEAAMAAFLAGGGKITTPEPRRLQVVVLRDGKGSKSRVWAKAQPALGTVSSKAGKRTPPRKFV